LELFNNNQKLEFAQAEVLAIDYSGYLKKSGYYTISCRLLNSYSDNDTITAIPIDYNLKKVPIVGESVILVVAASASSRSTSVGRKYYYMNTIPFHSSYNHNALPTVSSKNAEYYNQQDSQANVFATGRVLIKNTGEPTIDGTFQEPDTLLPLQMYSGDVLLEGRYGNSIRFGSTLKQSHPFGAAPAWSIGVSAVGDPITIITNGRRKSNGNNILSIESINEDDSSIWMTSGQQIFFSPSTSARELIFNNKIDTAFASNFSGNQLFLNSDRVNINAKKYEINLSSTNGISIASNGPIAVQSSNSNFEVESARINLGINAQHPAVMGDILLELLDQICTNLVELCDQLVSETHPTGVGPSGVPLNAQQYITIKQNLSSIKDQLPTINSALVYLNKSIFASDEVDRDANETYKQNIRRR